MRKNNEFFRTKFLRLSTCFLVSVASVSSLLLYNPQNETEDGNKSKWSKIKTKRDSPQNEAYLRVRFFNRPPYPIFAPKSTRLRRGQG